MTVFISTHIPHGPYTPVPGHPEQVIVTNLDFTPRTDLSLCERTRAIFGPTASYCRDLVVVTSPQGR